jgi:hypothetical protein
MIDKILEFVYTRTFSGFLTLLNGWLCLVNLSAGEPGWALLSGFFCWITARHYFRMR